MFVVENPLTVGKILTLAHNFRPMWEKVYSSHFQIWFAWIVMNEGETQVVVLIPNIFKIIIIE